MVREERWWGVKVPFFFLEPGWVGSTANLYLHLHLHLTLTLDKPRQDTTDKTKATFQHIHTIHSHALLHIYLSITWEPSGAGKKGTSKRTEQHFILHTIPYHTVYIYLHIFIFIQQASILRTDG